MGGWFKKPDIQGGVGFFVGETGRWTVKGDHIHPDSCLIKKDGEVLRQTPWGVSTLEFTFTEAGTYSVQGAECCPTFLWLGRLLGQEWHVVVGGWKKLAVAVAEKPVRACGPSAS